jgi:hypothetical protein
MLQVILDDSEDSDDTDDLLLTHYISTHRTSRLRKSWDSFSDVDFRHFFRFDKSDLDRLRVALRLPEKVRTSSRFVFGGNDALVLTLRRLAYPCRQQEIATQFNLSIPQVSQCTEKVIALLYDEWQHLLSFHRSRFGEQQLREFSDTLERSGCPLRRCVGFIDGTLRPTTKPQSNQRSVYSGHKRTHGIKFQAVVTPDGMISHLSGPFNGNRHDAWILTESGLPNMMRNGLRDGNGIFCFYGDNAYPRSPQLVSPYKGLLLDQDQLAFNRAMSRYRISVETAFGKVLQQFAFVDFKKNLKLYLQPVAKYYFVAALLTNCHSALYGSPVADLFGSDVPTLDQYLQEH